MNYSQSEYLTTRELAELLRIKERKVYALASSGQIPCTRATGKLLFPRREVDAWLAQNGSRTVSVEVPAERPTVFLGSHDPLLEWALKESGCRIASDFDGSLDGLERFAAGEGIAASIHLYDSDQQGWNVATVKKRFVGQSVVLVEFCHRERGLVMREEDAQLIRSVHDLRGRKVAPRQTGAGSQVLLLQLLEQQGLGASDVDFVDIAHSETEAVTSVLDGSADATLGLEGIAVRFGLHFTPLLRERFDLLVDRRAWFEPAFQAFWSFCQSGALREKAEFLQGYQVDGFGSIHFNG